MSGQAVGLAAPVFGVKTPVATAGAAVLATDSPAVATRTPVAAAKNSVAAAKTKAKSLKERLAGFLSEAFGENEARASKLTLDDLINAESAIGATIFGPVPAGHRREFFHHNNNVWIWHESWRDAAGVERETTIRYEVRPDGVYKRPLGSSYTKIKGAELENFRRAARLYLELVKQRLY